MVMNNTKYKIQENILLLLLLFYLIIIIIIYIFLFIYLFILFLTSNHILRDMVIIYTHNTYI